MFRAFSLVVALILTGCATATVYRHDAEFAASSDSRISSLHIGVLPFTYEIEEVPEDPYEAEVMPRDAVAPFEGHYLAARFAAALRESGAFASVHCVPTATPSVDMLLAVHVTRSDGEVVDLRITPRRVDGFELEVAKAGIDLSSGDFEDEPDPMRKMWITAVNRMIERLTEAENISADELLTIQAEAYVQSGGAKSAEISLDESDRILIGKAAAIEREKILEPVTSVMVEQAASVHDAYVRWQREATSMGEKKRSETVAAVGLGLTSLAAMGTGVYAASQGASLASLQPLNTAATSVALTAASSAEEASDLGTAAKELRMGFSSEVAPLTVKLSDSVYELTGSSESQLQQMRDIVRSQLAARPPAE